MNQLKDFVSKVVASLTITILLISALQWLMKALTGVPLFSGDQMIILIILGVVIPFFKHLAKTLKISKPAVEVLSKKSSTENMRATLKESHETHAEIGGEVVNTGPPQDIEGKTQPIEEAKDSGPQSYEETPVEKTKQEAYESKKEQKSFLEEGFTIELSEGEIRELRELRRKLRELMKRLG